MTQSTIQHRIELGAGVLAFRTGSLLALTSGRLMTTLAFVAGMVPPMHSTGVERELAELDAMDSPEAITVSSAAE